MRIAGLFALSVLLLFVSCRKDSYISSPDARVEVSADTLKFDTLFVTAGSTYRTLKIVNDNNQKLKISSLQLAGGNASAFKMNVDGIIGTNT